MRGGSGQGGGGERTGWRGGGADRVEGGAVVLRILSCNKSYSLFSPLIMPNNYLTQNPELGF